MKKFLKFFVIDVESIGLHGESFAVAGGIYSESGQVESEFCFSCNPSTCVGQDSDREWVSKNVPKIPVTHSFPKDMRRDFWNKWLKAKASGAIMAAECGWPVEAGFLSHCIRDEPSRTWEGPYPLQEIASYLSAAGFDPMAEYERNENETPKHHPLCDVRQSARLLFMAISKAKSQ